MKSENFYYVTPHFKAICVIKGPAALTLQLA